MVPRVVLIGLMGSGKSSIGRRLATRLELPLIDLDEYIVKETGLGIPEIFSRHGECEFRRLEHKALSKAIRRRAVIATGGGVVLSAENRVLLKQHPPVIWLKAEPEFLARRIEGDTNRPLVAAGDALEKLRELARVRHPLYAECANFILPRDQLKKDQATRMIVEHLSPPRQAF